MNLELFSCAGGMAEGFRRAGITFDFVFDFDPDACESYTRNLGHAPVRMDVHDLMRMVKAGWRPRGEIELLVADPPCTPWSRAGKRKGLDDERDMLAETVELVRLLRPESYLIANVPGLADETGWGAVQQTIGSLARSTGSGPSGSATAAAAASRGRCARTARPRRRARRCCSRAHG